MFLMLFIGAPGYKLFTAFNCDNKHTEGQFDIQVVAFSAVHFLGECYFNHIFSKKEAEERDEHLISSLLKNNT